MRKLLLASAATIAGSLALTGGAHAQPAAAPAPGTVAVYLHGNFTFAGAITNNPTASGTKLSPLNTIGYFRLYPGFDATTKGGLQYGVASEIRDTTAAPAGAGVNGNSTSPNGTVSLYVRRAYGYVGTKDAGYLRFGQGDSAFSLMSYGDIQSFGDGQEWNSDGGVGAIVPAGHPNNLFAVTGSLYTTSKLVYVSPSFAGVNFAVGFEPNSNGINEGASVAGASAQSTIPGGSTNRRRNTIDAMLGYTVAVDGVKYQVSAGLLDASPLGGSPLTTPASVGIVGGVPAVIPATTTAAPNYKNMTIAQFGGQVTYAGAVVGVNYKTGSVNNGYTFLLPGQRHDNDLLFSGMYTMGPIVVGASYFFNQSAGAYTVGSSYGRTQTNNGVAVGADYNIAANFTLFTQYLYGQLHQAHGTAAAANAHSNAISVGAVLKW
ncbi:MAG: hypothetical protein B7Z77_11020 [Acidocella sp. 20-58-15]|nr:MAG: hypothetical protein B7Z77_11020 [Acidocella sp. 20-58-15]